MGDLIHVNFKKPKKPAPKYADPMTLFSKVVVSVAIATWIFMLSVLLF